MNDNEQALNAFIANIAQIDNIARHFLDYADEHGYLNPDDVDWTHVGATAEIVRQLSEAAAFAGIDLTTDLDDYRDTYQQPDMFPAGDDLPIFTQP